MYIIYNDYFLSREFIQGDNSCCITEIYKCNNIVRKNSIIRFLYKIFIILNPLGYLTNNSELIFTFGVEDIIDLFFIKKKFRSRRITVWLWNPIKNNIGFKLLLLYLKLTKIKVITFDKSNAAKYKFYYYPQIFNKNLIICNDKVVDSFKKERSLFFYGIDKGRASILDKIKKNNKSLICDFSMIKDNTSIFDFNFYKKDHISYNDYLIKMKSNYCVLDLVQENQVGLTVRCIESLFMQKKLITNNKNIVNYDFYKLGNVLLLEDNYHEISNFLDSSFNVYPDELIDKYDIAHLIKYVKGINNDI